MSAPQVAEPLSRPDSAIVARISPSPNIEPRRGGVRPDLILLHYTGMSSAAKAIDWLSRPESKVSAHYVIDVDGTVTQLVAEAHRAWHAGQSIWAGECDINSLSIGIEIQNPGHADGYHAFPEPQMQAVAALCRDIRTRHPVPDARVLAHSDIAPLRKIDPGERFDWGWLAAQGIGHWVPPAPACADDRGLGSGAIDPRVALAQGLLRDYGYGVPDHGMLDALTARVVAAFQRHFRPQRIDGRLDRSTLQTLERLVAALPRPAAA